MRAILPDTMLTESKEVGVRDQILSASIFWQFHIVSKWKCSTFTFEKRLLLNITFLDESQESSSI
jgi:hypothetical protein